MFKYVLYDTENKEYVNLSLTELLEEINRDRSDEWSEYTIKDTFKSICEIVNTMTEYVFTGRITRTQ